MRRLPTYSPNWPSTTSCTTSVKVYSTVPTPQTMTAIVNHCSAAPNGSTSLNPTVVMVVTVWYSASSGAMPRSA